MNRRPSAKRPLALTATLIPCPEGGFTALCPQINGAISEGETEAEALANLRDAVAGVLSVNAAMTARRLKSSAPSRSPRPVKRPLMQLA
jgi:predicted RNase H-like HicB family nuclease